MLAAACQLLELHCALDGAGHRANGPDWRSLVAIEERYAVRRKLHDAFKKIVPGDYEKVGQRRTALHAVLRPAANVA
jgi:hypothetical protein